MTRPLYETEADLANEVDAQSVIESLWSCDIKKLPMRYLVDWAIFQEGKLRAYAEFKRRKHAMAKFDTLILSHHKWVAGKTLASEANVPFVVIVQFNDKLAFCETKHAAPISWSGRTDRGDQQDLEPVVHIPVSSFKVIA